MADLEMELKELIISSLDLEDITADEIVTEEPLFVEGLGLDSIDALELGLSIKKKYDIVLDANSEETQKHFYSVETLAKLIRSK